MVCPICNGNSFASFRGRSHAQCDSCKSLERHRLIWIFVRPLLSSATSVVHIAPEACLTKALRNSGCRYVSGDLVPSKADSKIDIRHMKFQTGSVDLFICSHVLEHVLDDFTDMREIVRVLAPGGMATHQNRADTILQWRRLPFELHNAVNVNVLSSEERAEILVAAFQCAYAMTPLLDAEVAVEAAVTGQTADWN